MRATFLCIALVLCMSGAAVPGEGIVYTTGSKRANTKQDSKEHSATQVPIDHKSGNFEQVFKDGEWRSEFEGLDQGADNCPAPVITFTGFRENGTTAGQADNHTPSCAYSAAPDVAFEYVPPVSGTTVVSLCGSSFDTVLEIWEDACPGTTWLACNDDSPNCGLQSEITLYMIAGVHYTIWVDGYGTNSGGYSIRISGPEPPGERGETAIPLSLPATVTGNTCSYRDDFGYNCAGSDTAGDVVYVIQPMRTVTVSISLCHSDFDTKLYVDDDSSFYSLVACNDDAVDCPCAAGPYRSYIQCITLPYLGGNSMYFIVVDGYGANCGDYELTIAECPSCDVTLQAGDVTEPPEDCADPDFHTNDLNGGWNSTPPQFGSVQNGQVIFGKSFTYDHHGTAARDTDHYLFTLSEWDTIRMWIWGSELPLVLQVWDTTTGQYYVNETRSACLAPTFWMTGYCVPPGTYVMAVFPDVLTGFPVPVDYRVQMNWQVCRPPNNECANAIPITVNSPTLTEGTAINATVDCAVNGYPEVWYEFDLTECANVTVAYCGTPMVVPYTTYMFRETCCGAPLPRYELGFSDCDDGETSMMFRGMIPGHYYLPIALVTPTDFSFRVFTEPYTPFGDRCEYVGSNWISSIPGYYDGRTTCATLDTLPACAVPATAPGVWYGVFGNGRTLTATTCNASYPATFDTRISVFTCDCSGMVCVGENDDFGCAPNQLASSVSWCSRNEERYLILVHGYGSSVGDYRITVTDNGLACGVPIACLDHEFTAPGQVSGNTTGRRDDCAMLPSEDVQARVTIPYAGWWKFSLCGSNFDTRIYVDTVRCGGGYQNLDAFECSPQSQLCMSLAPRDMFVTIEGEGAGGNYLLTVSPSGPASVVQGVHASDSICGGVLVSWLDSDDELGYLVWRDGDFLETIDNDETEYFDSSPSPGWHLYHVTSFNGCLVSQYSLADSGRKVEPVTAAPALLTPPAGTPILSGQLASFCCSVVSNAMAYNYVWDDDPLFQSLIGHTDASACVANSFYVPMGTWYWKVRGENACGFGPWSVVWSFQLVNLAPPELVIAVEGTMVRLYWTASEIPVEYWVESAASADGPYSHLATTMDTAFVTSFQPNNMQFYRVLAVGPVSSAASDETPNEDGSE